MGVADSKGGWPEKSEMEIPKRNGAFEGVLMGKYREEPFRIDVLKGFNGKIWSKHSLNMDVMKGF